LCLSGIFSDTFDAGNLTVEGTANLAYTNISKSLNVTGTVNASSNISISEGATITGREKVVFQYEGGFSFDYTVETAEELKDAVAEAYNTLQKNWQTFERLLNEAKEEAKEEAAVKKAAVEPAPVEKKEPPASAPKKESEHAPKEAAKEPVMKTTLKIGTPFGASFLQQFAGCSI